MARHSFQPRTSIFPRFVLYFPILRALLRDISPFIFPALPFVHSENTFPIRFFPFFILYPTFLFPLISFPPFIPPTLHLPPPLSFSFLPTFPSSSPINARARAPSRTTRVRVRSHLLARQEVFVYCLHRFTNSSQSTVHQRVRGEAKQEKAFTKTLNHLKIKTLDKTPDFIHRKLHLITAVNPTIPTVNLKTKSLHPLRAVPQPFAVYR